MDEIRSVAAFGDETCGVEDLLKAYGIGTACKWNGAEAVALAIEMPRRKGREKALGRNSGQHECDQSDDAKRLGSARRFRPDKFCFHKSDMASASWIRVSKSSTSLFAEASNP